ncbi:MAG: hypothetical protein HY459_01310 [Parcubacteria group bacterium]|nr:hypothetical protein [Parcubacteria group bacterium]
MFTSKKMALAALMLGAIGLSTFFLNLQTYLYLKPTFWIPEILLYRVTIPLLIISLVLNSAALVQDVRSERSVLLEALVFAMYLLFIILYVALPKLGIVVFEIDRLYSLS